MREVMYDHSSFLIVAILFVALLLATEFGFRLGKKYAGQTNSATKTQVSAIQTSILGVLALLLGFTFSLALQRYDARSQAVIAESNAIGTALQRAELLPDAIRPDVQRMLRQYLDLRVEASTISLDRVAERDAVVAKSNELFNQAWQAVVETTKQDPPFAQAMFVMQSLNAMADTFSERNAALDRHVPELVLFLMFLTLILAASLVGYVSGVSKHRATFAAYILLALIICLVFLIIDLDRPRRGLVEVSQQSLVDLQATQSIGGQ